MVNYSASCEIGRKCFRLVWKTGHLRGEQRWEKSILDRQHVQKLRFVNNLMC